MGTDTPSPENLLAQTNHLMAWRSERDVNKKKLSNYININKPWRALQYTVVITGASYIRRMKFATRKDNFIQCYTRRTTCLRGGDVVRAA